MTVVAQDTATYRAVLDSVFAGPEYRWAERPELFAGLSEWWNRLGRWLESLLTGNPVGFRVFLIVLAALLAMILLHGMYVAFRTVQGGVRASDPEREGIPALARDAAWYRREADRAAAEGRLLDALQLAFAGLALTLQADGVLRYHPSMTPAECVTAARLVEDDRARLRGLVHSLYAHVFGGQPLAVADYEQWRAVSAGPWHAAPH